MDHLHWISQLIMDTLPDVIVNIGDWYDMHSLSSWDKGTRNFEKRRYSADIESGNLGLEILEAPLLRYNKKRAKNKKAQYLPEKHYTLGNHEHRADRMAQKFPEFYGTVGTEEITQHWEDRGWNVHKFLHAEEIDGIVYVHFVPNPMTGKPLGGMIETRLKNVGRSFTMGHQQIFAYGNRYIGSQITHGLIAGSCYMHDEEYKGPAGSSVISGNHHWRGVVLKHQVRNGDYCLEPWDLNRLCVKYSGANSLKEYIQETYPNMGLSLGYSG